MNSYFVYRASFYLMLTVATAALSGDSGESRFFRPFDEEVALGEFREIDENETVVMTVKFTDMAGKTIRPPGEPLWRGVTMLRYQSGRWRRQPRDAQMYVGFPGRNLSGKLLRQEIKLQAVNSPTLFAIRPIRSTDAGHRLPPVLNPMDGTLQRPDLQDRAYDYKVLSDPDPAGFQMGEQPPDLAYSKGLLAIPESLKARLRKIAEPVVADIREEGRKGTEGRDRALESVSAQFPQVPPFDAHGSARPQARPRRGLPRQPQGGALRVLRQRPGAHASLDRHPDPHGQRIQGGRLGRDHPDHERAQKHAHSWVEAFVGLGPESQPIWITLDPTPGEERKKP